MKSEESDDYINFTDFITLNLIGIRVPLYACVCVCVYVCGCIHDCKAIFVDKMSDFPPSKRHIAEMEMSRPGHGHQAGRRTMANIATSLLFTR